LPIRNMGGDAWQIDISRKDKPRHRETRHFETERDAHAYEVLLRKEFEIEDKTSKYTVEAVWPKYREWLKSNNHCSNPRSLTNRIDALDKVCTYFSSYYIDFIPTQAQVVYRDLRLQEIRERIVKKKGIPVEQVVRGGERAVNLELMYLYGMSTWALEKEHLYATAHIAALKPLQENVTNPKPIPIAIVRRLFAEMDTIHKAMCLIMLQAGLRKHEVFSLKKEDINWDAKTVDFMGKGMRPDVFTMTPAIEKAMESVPGIHDGIGIVFPPKPGSKSPTRFQIDKAIAGACKRAGIQIHITLHQLRHTFATETLSSRGNIKLTKEALRHTQMRSTEKYSKWLRSQINDMVSSTFGDDW